MDNALALLASHLDLDSRTCRMVLHRDGTLLLVRDFLQDQDNFLLKCLLLPLDPKVLPRIELEPRARVL